MAGSRFFLLLALLVCLLPSAAAAQERPPSIVGAIKDGADCATTPVSTRPPAFIAGDTIVVCFSAPLPTGTAPDITIGQAHAVVGEPIGTGLRAVVPRQMGGGEYAVSGTLAGQPLNTLPVQVYAVPRPKLVEVNPTSATRGKDIRINGEGLAAPASETQVWFGDEKADVQAIGSDGSYLVARIPSADTSTTGGSKPVAVSVWGIPANLPTGGLNVTVRQPVGPGTTLAVAAWAAVPFIAVGLIIAGLYFTQPDTPKSRRKPFIAALIMERQTDTYSLSRAQFYWWLLVVGYAYAFLFIGHGIIEGSWVLPPLSGFGFTLLISTGTLLLATATGSVRSKGSGAIHPRLSDLIVQGGVVAPERVQQVLWTILGGVGLLWIVFNTYESASTLPDVPTELLGLMGLSSAAYLGGKLVRPSGPNIRQVDVAVVEGEVQLTVFGEGMTADSTVLLDGKRLDRADITSQVDTQQKVTLQLSTHQGLVEWPTRNHMVVVVNTDGQRSEWEVRRATPEATTSNGSALTVLAAVPAVETPTTIEK